MIRHFVLTLALASPLGAQASPAIDYTQLREETAQRLSEYIRINTSNPPGNELAAARWLAGVLAKEGIQGTILDTAALGEGRANFYAKLPGSGGGRSPSCTTWTWSRPRRRTGPSPRSPGRSRTAMCGAAVRST